MPQLRDDFWQSWWPFIFGGLAGRAADVRFWRLADLLALECEWAKTAMHLWFGWTYGGFAMARHVTRRMILLSGVGATMLLSRTAMSAWPMVTVHKDPNCGCCGGWVAHLETHGFQVKVIETTELNRVRARLGVPFDLQACHTAQVAGYLIEGHVPAPALEKFLREKPDALGLAVPGMPSGSPGMTGDYEEYDVILFGKNERRVYGRYKGENQI
jgi:hypothetical protein